MGWNCICLRCSVEVVVFGAYPNIVVNKSGVFDTVDLLGCGVESGSNFKKMELNQDFELSSFQQVDLHRLFRTKQLLNKLETRKVCLSGWKEILMNSWLSLKITDWWYDKLCIMIEWVNYLLCDVFKLSLVQCGAWPLSFHLCHVNSLKDSRSVMVSSKQRFNNFLWHTFSKNSHVVSSNEQNWNGIRLLYLVPA